MSACFEAASNVLCRTVRWLDRCIAAHKRPTEQNLFPIVQGGLDADLRVQCAKGMLDAYRS